jgi:hypothetical protein
MDECTLFCPFDEVKGQLISDMARIIIWMINKNNQTLKHLKELFQSIETFYHPSNEGSWTGPLSEFLLILSNRFSDRYKRENEGDLKDIDKEYHLTVF